MTKLYISLINLKEKLLNFKTLIIRDFIKIVMNFESNSNSNSNSSEKLNYFWGNVSNNKILSSSLIISMITQIFKSQIFNNYWIILCLE